MRGASFKSGGLSVYGIGKEKTPQALRRACTQFISLPELIKPVSAEAA